ncbi:MAG: Ig-like domain-containing protein [Candidatus Korobacteraceae bacterium]
MGSAGTGSSFVDSRGESSPGTGGDRPTRLRQRLVLTVAVSLALSPFLTSCSGFFVKPTISSLYITPSAATLGVGQSTPLTATATYSDGTQNQLSGDSVGWTSSDTTTATVTSPGGSVTGVGLGTATITASAQGVTGTATVTVTVANITSLVITTTQGSTQNQTTATISGAPASLQFYAYANGSANNDVTQAVTWTSSNTNVATISTGLTSGSGLATSVAAGTTNITATTTNSATGQAVKSQTIVLTVQ